MNQEPLTAPASNFGQQLHTVEKTLELLGGISRSTFYRMVAAGKIRTVRLGHRTMVSRGALSELLESIGA
jgi:excisionase family DNA binding protein